MTGKNEWIVTNKDYDDMETDLSQEFSRSHYFDMVHDTERNEKYYYGLHWVICHWESKGVEPRVLDIGTGTGLLAMMAGRWGATNVTACEVLSPMVKIAKEVVKVNGYDKVIKIINKRSTELTVGLGCDIPYKANVLVSEVFDSELIGEGAIETFTHAKKHLLTISPSIMIRYMEPHPSKDGNRGNICTP